MGCREAHSAIGGEALLDQHHEPTPYDMDTPGWVCEPG